MRNSEIRKSSENRKFWSSALISFTSLLLQYINKLQIHCNAIHRLYLSHLVWIFIRFVCRNCNVFWSHGAAPERPGDVTSYTIRKTLIYETYLAPQQFRIRSCRPVLFATDTSLAHIKPSIAADTYFLNLKFNQSPNYQTHNTCMPYCAILILKLRCWETWSNMAM